VSRRRQAGGDVVGCPPVRHRRVGAASGNALLGRRGDRGSFTAELAAGLPALVLLLAVGVSAISAVVTKSESVDLAGAAALASAGGDAVPPSAGPTGAQVEVTFHGDLVTVTVHAPLRALGARLPRSTVTATATAVVEPGVVTEVVPAAADPVGHP
jgi:hypothetical protein